VVGLLCNTRIIFWDRMVVGIDSYVCSQCISQLTWVRIRYMRVVFNTTLYDKVCQWLVAGRWFSPGTPVSSTNKTDRHDITEILLKMAWNTINPNLNPKLLLKPFRIAYYENATKNSCVLLPDIRTLIMHMYTVATIFNSCFNLPSLRCSPTIGESGSWYKTL